MLGSGDMRISVRGGACAYLFVTVDYAFPCGTAPPKVVLD